MMKAFFTKRYSRPLSESEPSARNTSTASVLLNLPVTTHYPDPWDTKGADVDR